MKKILFVLVAMLTVLSVDAQIVTSRSRSIKAKVSDNYTRVYGGYSNFGFKHESFNGADFGVLKGINIASAPLFVEFGGELGWNMYSADYYDYSDSWHILSVSLPVSLSYKFDIDNGISIMPFTGPNFRLNVYDSVGKGDQNIFQAGWNVGIGFAFNQFYVGYRFTANFNEYAEHWDEGGKINAVNIGYQF